MKEKIKLWSILIGIFGFLLSVPIFDLFNIKNIFSVGYFIAMFFALMIFIPMFTLKEEQRKITSYSEG